MGIQDKTGVKFDKKISNSVFKGWWTVLKEDHEAGRKLKLKLSVKKLINQVDQVPEGGKDPDSLEKIGA